MIKFILVVVGLTIVVCEPILLFLAAGFGLAWLWFKRPNIITSLPNYLTTPGGGGNEPDEDLSRDIKERPTTEEVYAKEVERSMKPGYKDDPRWQELAAKAEAHNAQIKKEDEEEAHLEELTDEVV